MQRRAGQWHQHAAETAVVAAAPQHRCCCAAAPSHTRTTRMRVYPAAPSPARSTPTCSSSSSPQSICSSGAASVSSMNARSCRDGRKARGQHSKVSTWAFKRPKRARHRPLLLLLLLLLHAPDGRRHRRAHQKPARASVPTARSRSSPITTSSPFPPRPHTQHSACTISASPLRSPCAAARRPPPPPRAPPRAPPPPPRGRPGPAAAASLRAGAERGGAGAQARQQGFRLGSGNGLGRRLGSRGRLGQTLGRRGGPGWRLGGWRTPAAHLAVPWHSTDRCDPQEATWSCC